jgi:carboxyl-terminal processing protease
VVYDLSHPVIYAVKLQGLALCLILAAVVLGGCARTLAPGAAAPASRSVDSQLALLTFDSAWSRIAHTHYDTAFNGVDWTGVRDELRPRAAEAATIRELRVVISEMLGRLGESHFTLIPGEARDLLAANPAGARSISGSAGFQVRLVEGDLLVWRVQPGSAAAAAGVRTGWTLVSVDSRPVATRVAALAALPEAERRRSLTSMLYGANAELAGDVGTAVEVRFRDERGNAVDRTLVLREIAGEVVQFGNLPPVLAVLEHDVLPAGAGCIGVIRLNVWMGTLGPAFDRAVDEMRRCNGVIVDLRGNPGGLAGMVMGTAGHFLNDTLVLGRMQQRTTALRLKANPRRVSADGSIVEPFSGPLAIIIDEMSASTSEFFAAGLQGVGRARVFGAPSAGQALPALMVRLPTGDVLMHVIANFTGPHGVRIEGYGVVPDVPATSSREDLLAGRDVPMLNAIDWITGAAGANPTHPGGSQP